MKKIYLTIAFISCFVLILQAQADSLRIIYDATKGGVTCQPTGQPKMYFYSGAGFTDSTAVWQAIVGTLNVDDGIGQMDNGSTTDEWKFTIHLYNYYGKDPQTVTIYNIGFFFQNGDGSAEGKDYACNPMAIKGLNGPSPTVEQNDGTPFDGVTAEWVAPDGIGTPETSGLEVAIAPNPFAANTTISFNLLMAEDNLKVNIYDMLGQKVFSVYDGIAPAAEYKMEWDGSNNSGHEVQEGIYFLVIESRDLFKTYKIVKR